MVAGRQEAEWGRTSSVMALMAELKRNRKRKLSPWVPADFDPTRDRTDDDDDDTQETVSIATLASIIPGSKYKANEVDQ